MIQFTKIGLISNSRCMIIKYFTLITYIVGALYLLGCRTGAPEPESLPESDNQEIMIPDAPSEDTVSFDAEVVIDASTYVSRDYLGNGVQWDPYEMYDISDTDWQKIYYRLDFMKPQFIRMMHNTSGKMEDDIVDYEVGLDHLTHLLDYCQRNGIVVMFGDWGGRMVDPVEGTINETLLKAAVQYVNFLINEKGYDCIKYFNLVNEPNGSWSQTKGNYALWGRAVRFFWEEVKRVGLDDKLSMAAPDVAIWTSGETNWISNTVNDLSDAVGIYDIHTYPSKSTVNSGKYADIIRAYKDAAPSDARIVMGEIGFKYIEPEDAEYQAENIRRAERVSHASKEDSQMLVYDYMYGTDMADAVFQTINAGYSGCVAWMLDDAMHFKEPGKLKIWGFWNIFGDEFFGSEHEVVRPWYYAWSLLCRFFPRGSDFYTVDVSGKDGVKAVAGVCGDKRTLAIVNVSKEERKVKVSSTDFPDMDNVWKYIYGEGLFSVAGDCTMRPVATGQNFFPLRGEMLLMKPESLIVLTEIRCL